MSRALNTHLDESDSVCRHGFPWIATLALLVAGLVLACAGASGDSADSADSLDVAQQWLNERRYADVESLMRRILPRVENEHGASSVQVALALDHLVNALWRTGQGRAEETMALAQRAVTVKESLHGPNHPDVAESLFNLGILHAMGGDYAGADSICTRVLLIRERALPEEHPDIAAAINALANVRQMAADYGGSLELYRRSLQLAEASGGRLGPQAVSIRGNVASALVKLGEYAEARELLADQIVLLERENHPELVKNINLLANMQYQLGDYASALDLYRRSLPLAEANGGALAPWAVSIRGNLAGALVRLGEYGEARAVLERQIALLESQGTENEYLGRAYNLLAGISNALGDHEEELLLRRRCLEIREAFHPPGHPQIGEALLNLGTTLALLGRVEEQKALIVQAKAIWEERFGPEHPELAGFFEVLGGIAYHVGDLAEARGLFEQALHIRELSLGASSLGGAHLRIQLGRVERDAGDLEGARAHLERALATMVESVGPEHPLAAESGLELAWVEFAAGEFDVALHRAVAAERVLTPHLRLTLRVLPERQALRYAEQRARSLDLLISLLDVIPEPAHTVLVWEAVVHSRALVLDEMAARTRSLAADDPDDSVRLADYRRASTRLANLYVRGPEGSEPEVYRAMLDGARREMESAERVLSETGRVGSALGSDRNIGWADVERAIPGDCVLLAYARHGNRPPGAPRTGESGEQYRAFISAPTAGRVASVGLGDAERIDRLITTWREEASLGIFREDRAREESVRACQRAGVALREAIWDPVAGFLGDGRTVLVVPAGQIHLVNLAALPADDGTFLIESAMLIHCLSAEREIARVQKSGPGTETALVLGAPDFGGVGIASIESPHPTSDAPTVQPVRGARPDCLDLRSIWFAPLPGAMAEAREVAAFWESRSESRDDATDRAGGVLLLTGPDATEEAFKHLAPGRRVLHLATHGFVLDEGCTQVPPEARGIGLLVADEPESGSQRASSQIRQSNPLLLSGLALAGANQRSEVDVEGEDGILTAQEIAALDLAEARWAVLSACQTGTGSVQSGEGVLGLQRAFRMAGVQTLVTSLWSVRDEETRLWMSAFYQGIAEQGLTTAEAVRSAGVALLRHQRERGEDTHPFHWAGFIATGDWR